MRWLAIGVFVLAAHGQTLQDRLKSRIGDFQGTVSLYARNLDTGATVDVRGSDPTRTASTIKLAILCSVFDAISREQAKWTDPLTITHAEKVNGSGIIGTELSDGVQLPLQDVAHLMMVLSDNTATNMILERFGANMVNAYLDRIGIPNTRSMRKILGASDPGISAAGKLPENQKFGLGKSCPRDMVTILEKLEHGGIVSPEASKEILTIMKRCQDNTGIRRHMGG
ncbi:MAG TPA: serine hydrolase, partial [Bryobacteraceae bacterium]